MDFSSYLYIAPEKVRLQLKRTIFDFGERVLAALTDLLSL